MSWAPALEAIAVTVSALFGAGALVVAMRANGRADRAIEQARRSADAAEISADASQRSADAAEATARTTAADHHLTTGPGFVLTHHGPYRHRSDHEVLGLQCRGPLEYSLNVIRIHDRDASPVDLIFPATNEAMAQASAGDEKLVDVGTMRRGEVLTVVGHRRPSERRSLRLEIDASAGDSAWVEVVVCEFPKRLTGPLMS